MSRLVDARWSDLLIAAAACPAIRTHQKQVALLARRHVAFEKIYRVHFQSWANVDDVSAAITLRLHNDEKAELGIPLPAGTTTLYEPREGTRLNRDRVEAACSRALDVGARTYDSVRSIFDQGLDQMPPVRPASGSPIDHPNIRGSRYYH